MNEDQFQSENEFRDEFISAYLDGELSAEEKARVEEQLMDSAEHRQLFEELKTIRAAMQAMPRHSLDDDFAARVLQRAEQRLLVGECDAPTPRETIAAIAAPGSVLPDRGAWRGLAWSVAAMAAAIMLIVFSPLLRETNHSPSNRPVAVIDPIDKPNDAEHGQADENLAGKQRAAEEQMQKQTPAPLANEGSRADDQLPRRAARSQRSPVAADGQIENYDNRGRDGFADQLNGNPRDGNFAGGALPGIAQQQGQGQGGGVGHGDSRSSENSGRPTSPPQVAFSASTARGGPTSQSAPPENALASRFSQFPGAATFRQGEIDGAQTLAAMAKKGNEPAASDMMVVSVDVTPDALSRHFMDELLQKHKIQTDKTRLALARQHGDGIALANQANDQNERQLADLSAGLQQSAQAGAPAVGAEDLIDGRDLEGRRQQASALDRAEQTQVTGDVEVMVVVATVEQINDLLGDMQSRSEDVLAMAYDRPIFASEYEAKTAKLLKNQASLEKQTRANRDQSAVENDRARRGKPAAGKDQQQKDKEAQQRSKAEDESFGQTEDKDLNSEAFGQSADRSPDDDQFRGIARRLRLPEDFQKRLGQNQPDPKAAGEGGAQPPVAKVRSRDAHEGAKIDTQTLADAMAEESRFQSSRKSEASQRLVRVLFVLRASGGDRLAPLADRIPVEDLPANAALRESLPTEADAAAPPVDE